MFAIDRLATTLGRIFIALAMWGSALTSAHAAAATRYDIVAPGASQPPHHWIVLLARPAALASSSPGHAFVEFGHEDETAHMTRFEAWGFYPEAGGKGFSAVPGQIVDDVRSGSLASRTVIVSVAVSKESFEAARRVKDEWTRRPPSYQLVTAKNCIDFVDATARSLGLAAPDRSTTQLPVDYVEALGRANQ